MNRAIRQGKSSELIVAGELVRRGLDVYSPCVDDQGIDLVVRVEQETTVRHFDVQIKSASGYNRIAGVRLPERRLSDFILVVHYRHDDRPDEFFYLTGEQAEPLVLKGSNWRDLRFNKPERDQFAHQDLRNLAEFLAGQGRALTSHEIGIAALRHAVTQLGSAIGVGEPVRNGDKWVVELFSQEGGSAIGSLYLTLQGEVMEDRSSDYKSIRAQHNATGKNVSAA